MVALVLGVDKLGYPTEWMSLKKAAQWHAKGKVLWSTGEVLGCSRGGSPRNGRESSEFEISSVIGINGQALGKAPDIPPSVNGRLGRSLLFARDRWMCAYCGEVFPDNKLSKDHILPVSRGGPDTWMNVVAACKSCNSRKSNRLPHEAGMELLYSPYVPNRSEGLILRNRLILADQMEFLLARVPKNSRLLLS